MNVGPCLANKFPDTWRISDSIKCDEPFGFKEVTEYEVLKLVKDIKIAKSSAYEGVSTHLFKDAFEILITELTHLYNRCLRTGTFPKSWGSAEVSSVPKQVTSEKLKTGVLSAR